MICYLVFILVKDGGQEVYLDHLHREDGPFPLRGHVDLHQDCLGHRGGGIRLVSPLHQGIGQPALGEDLYRIQGTGLLLPHDIGFVPLCVAGHDLLCDVDQDLPCGVGQGHQYEDHQCNTGPVHLCDADHHLCDADHHL